MFFWASSQPSPFKRPSTALRILLRAAVSGRPAVGGLYYTANICFPGINSEKLIIGLQNIAVSNGSACNAKITEPSHVLKAMGLSDADALASIRFSLGRFNTPEEIDTTVAKVTELISKMRQPYVWPCEYADKYRNGKCFRP
jgi:cysteine sulfinate desulfinase/cysteine desulfurase-like protein